MPPFGCASARPRAGASVSVSAPAVDITGAAAGARSLRIAGRTRGAIKQHASRHEGIDGSRLPFACMR